MQAMLAAAPQRVVDRPRPARADARSRLDVRPRNARRLRFVSWRGAR
jgi:hypothetical protein